MSNRSVDTTADIGFSPAIDRPSVRRLHEHYAATCGHVDRGQMRLIFSRAGRFKHAFSAPLKDGYLPFVGATFSAGVGASIALAFPHFTDDSGEDGTSTDRLVSVHTMGDVSDDMFDEILGRIAEEIAALLPKPAEPDVPHDLWQGSSEAGGVI